MYKRAIFLFCISLGLLNSCPKILVGIAGGTGSGKTTLATKIQKAFPYHSILISQDSYYKELGHLPFEERNRSNFDHPDSLDFALMREHILALQAGLSIDQPIYSFHSHMRLDQTLRVESAPLIIVEGILLFAADEVRDLFDLKVFVDTDDDIRILRRIERDIQERGRDLPGIKTQYLETVKPMHDAFVAPSKRFADVIVPEWKENEVALSIIVAKLQSHLQEHAISA